MLYYDRIDISEGIEPTKSNKRRECMICHVSNDCHDLTMLCFNISDIAIITVKSGDYRCIM